MKSNKWIALGLAVAVACSGFSGMSVHAGEAREAESEDFDDGESLHDKVQSAEGYNYLELEDGTVQIIGYTGSDTEITIPTELDGKPVAEIESGTFIIENNLKRITLPANDIKLSPSSFRNCPGLEEIIVDSNHPRYFSQDGILYLKGEVGWITLRFCPEGKSGDIVIPDIVDEISGEAFMGCTKLTGVTIPDHIREIKRDTFSFCSSLKSFTCPKELVWIESNAFMDCSSLTNVTIPKSVEYISDTAFRGCGSDLTLLVAAGSDAEQYAKEYNIKYRIVEGDQDNPNPACVHSWTSVITPAKVNGNGSIQTKCTKCGAIQSTAVLYAPASIALSQTEYIYNGKEHKPAVTVKDSRQKALAEQKDYTVSYPAHMKNVGKYTVKVQFKGNYSGTMEQEFTIVPKSASITKVTAKKKGFAIKWKKQANQTTGYEISYSTDSKFKKGVSKPIVIKKVKTTSKTINKLKPKKKYYVRIRTYKKANGKKIYSAWSKVKQVTTKK